MTQSVQVQQEVDDNSLPSSLSSVTPPMNSDSNSNNSAPAVNSVSNPSVSRNAANVTYDKLFELLRTERTDPNLQQLPPAFFVDVRAYLALKQESIAKSKISTDIFAADHVETVQQQVRNALHILADIYDRRERKIVNLALNKVRAVGHNVDTSKLLVEEKALFTHIVTLLSAQRATVQKLLTQDEIVVLPSASSAPLPGSAIDSQVSGAQTAALACELVTANSVAQTASVQTQSDSVAEKYEVIAPISEFFGPDMQRYGPFAVGDQASFSEQIVRILIKKNLVKLIE